MGTNSLHKIPLFFKFGALETAPMAFLIMHIPQLMDLDQYDMILLCSKHTSSYNQFPSKSCRLWHTKSVTTWEWSTILFMGLIGKELAECLAAQEKLAWELEATWTTTSLDKGGQTARSMILPLITTNTSTHRWARGGVRGGSTPSEIFFYDPPLRFKMTPTPLRNGFWPPIKFWAGDVFFLGKDKKNLPRKKNFAGLRRHQFLAKEGQNSHKNFCVGPPWPPLF